MNPSIATESISSLQVSNVQNLKGGEKTTSEWEELDKLTKDELIIELVKARYIIRNMCNILGEISATAGSHFLYDEGDKPSKEWMDKIVSYAESKLESGDELDSSDLEHYGINGDYADEYCYGPEDGE